MFGATKLSQTNLAIAAAANWDLRVTILRPFNLLGPGLPLHYFAGAFAHRLLEERAQRPSDEMGVREVTVNNAHATRDFVDVRDAAAAILAAVGASPRSRSGAIYNVATGRRLRSSPWPRGSARGQADFERRRLAQTGPARASTGAWAMRPAWPLNWLEAHHQLGVERRRPLGRPDGRILRRSLGPRRRLSSAKSRVGCPRRRAPARRWLRAR